MSEGYSGRVITYGTSESADVRAMEAEIHGFVRDEGFTFAKWKARTQG